jgi:hypothetical protein
MLIIISAVEQRGDSVDYLGIWNDTIFFRNTLTGLCPGSGSRNILWLVTTSSPVQTDIQYETRKRLSQEAVILLALEALNKTRKAKSN